MEPGLLNDLQDAGQKDWDKYVANLLSNAVRHSGSQHLVADGDTDLGTDPVPVDWGGMPVRIRECLQSEKDTNQFLDWVNNGQPYGRLLGSHEEYLEWLVTRDTTGKIARVDMTTETPEFWRILAKHHPSRTLQILGEFARDSGPAPIPDVYGNVDPFSVTPAEREAAFGRMMFPQGTPPQILSPYNNGAKTLAFMTVRVNTLRAAIDLAAYAAKPYTKEVDGQEVPLGGREAIRYTEQAAQDCRNSDPTIVGSVISFVAEGRKLALMDPAGLYIADVDSDGLLFPDEQTPVPRDWFRLSRGSKLTTPGGTFSLSQRLSFNVPACMGFSVGDLVDATTGDKVKYGGQIASKVTVALYVKASAPNLVQSPSLLTQVGQVPPCRDEPACQEVRDTYNIFQQTQSITNTLQLAVTANRSV